MENSEKISQVYADLFRRMCGIKGELPDSLLKRYFQIKKLSDKIDGRLSSCDLARIALECGFDPDTMKFEIGYPVGYGPGRKPADDENAVKIIPAELGKDVLGGTAGEPAATFEQKVDDEIQEAEQTIPTAAEAGFNADDIGKIDVKTGNTIKPFEVGDKVNVLRDDDIVDGEITGVFPGEINNYKVKLDDDSEEVFSEKELEARK